MNKLFKNGTIVTASDMIRADLLVEGETIKQIGVGMDETGLEVIDANGKYLLPGGIDPHTHFDLPMFNTVSSDDHYTGSKAAAFGGTTTVMDFIGLENNDFQRSFESWRALTEKSAVDHSAHMNLTHFDDDLARQLPGLAANGITTLKVFTAYNGRLRLDDGSIFKALLAARESGMLVMAHCENGDVIEQLVPKALAAGHTSPAWHAYTRPKWGAVESSLRMAAMRLCETLPGFLF